MAKGKGFPKFPFKLGEEAGWFKDSRKAGETSFKKGKKSRKGNK